MADGSLNNGRKWAILLKWLTNLRIIVFPSEGGRSITKSKHMWDRKRLKEYCWGLMGSLVLVADGALV